MSALLRNADSPRPGRLPDSIQKIPEVKRRGFFLLFPFKRAILPITGSGRKDLLCCHLDEASGKEFSNEESEPMRISEERYSLIDGVRGIAIINMVVFHFLYDVFVVYEKAPSWYGLPTIHVWQQMICWTFIFISGFVWPWGMKGNLWRGLRFNLYGFVISIVTLIVIPSDTTWLYRNWGYVAGRSSFTALFYENFNSIWISLSGLPIKRLFPYIPVDFFVPMRIFF